MKIYAIGDIHGCLEELKQILELIDNQIEPEDEIVFLGDYVDRGPDSKGVIDLLIDRRDNDLHKHAFLRGNHEEMMIDYINSNGTDGYSWFQNGGFATIISYGWGDGIPDTHIYFLEDTKLLYRNGKYVFVHAGIDRRLPIEENTPQKLLWTRNNVDYKGSYPEDVFVVFGHTPKELVNLGPNQVGIDTGCVFGNKLTCAIIDIETNQIDYLFVESTKQRMENDDGK